MTTRQTILSAATMASDIAGTPIKVSRGDYLVIGVDWEAAASPSGTFKWQYSPDYTPGRASSASWKDLEKEGTAVTMGSNPDGTTTAGDYAETFEDATGWLRLYYTATAGGGGDAVTVTAERGYRR